MSLHVGDSVIVNDPEYGPRPGRVSDVGPAVDGSGLLYTIDGPHLPQDSRIWQWTIRADVLDQYVAAR